MRKRAIKKRVKPKKETTSFELVKTASPISEVKGKTAQQIFCEAENILAGYWIKMSKLEKRANEYLKSDLKRVLPIIKKQQLLQLPFMEKFSFNILLLKHSVEKKINEIEEEEFSSNIDLRKILSSGFDERIFSKEISNYMAKSDISRNVPFNLIPSLSKEIRKRVEYIPERLNSFCEIWFEDYLKKTTLQLVMESKFPTKGTSDLFKILYLPVKEIAETKGLHLYAAFMRWLQKKDNVDRIIAFYKSSRQKYRNNNPESKSPWDQKEMFNELFGTVNGKRKNTAYNALIKHWKKEGSLYPQKTKGNKIVYWFKSTSK